MGPHADLITQDDSSKRPEMKLSVPEILKVILVDDWEAVTKNNQVRSLDASRKRSTNNVASQLVPLPRSPNVIEILKEFEQHVLSQPDTTYAVLSPDQCAPHSPSPPQLERSQSLTPHDHRRPSNLL